MDNLLSKGGPGGAQPVVVGTRQLPGFLAVPPDARGLVIFAHGSGSGRFSPRNQYVAYALQEAGFATLLLDLLTKDEEANRANVFDTELLAVRLSGATMWARSLPTLSKLPIGYFGASTGAGAAIVAAARGSETINAIVSRGGRPDRAGSALRELKAPTLLLVGSRDGQVLSLNRQARAQMRCHSELVVIPGATHLFEEPGALDDVVAHAIGWFQAYLAAAQEAPQAQTPFADRRAAGRALAGRLLHLRKEHPLVLALPRGGVPVAYELAKALDAQLDLLFVRKLGAPGNPEIGIGAIVGGDAPQMVIDREIVKQTGAWHDYLERATRREAAEMERQRRLYLGARPQVPLNGRTIIVVDDGIATGATITAALRGIRRAGPARLIVAVPVASREALSRISQACDELVCLATPQPFTAVGAHYLDFTQVTDDETIRLLDAAQLASALAID